MADTASRGSVFRSDTPLEHMRGIAALNPVYFNYTDPTYEARMFAPAAKQGQVVFLKIGEAFAFFSFLWPDKPILPPFRFQEELWSQRGPVLWIGDVVCTPGVSGVVLGKAIRYWIRRLAIAQRGQKVIFWRSNRLGYAIVR